MFQLHNSLTKTKSAFVPLTPGEVKLYVCGVTVYDYCHIGHARTYATFDLLCRYLRSTGWKVTYVRNITDVDDKIIKRAAENQESCEALTTRFIEAMHDDFKALHFLTPDLEPKATETMGAMIKMIETLVLQGIAYVADNGDVYYDTTRCHDYGLLAQQDLESLQVGARVEVNSAKRNPLDFVLWKRVDDETITWASPWGAGRPGWHIECSAMSTSLLGNTIDIHGGGNDLKFPHHENERAQAEACTHQRFVNTWMHVGFVQVNDEKMSKSLGNFFTIRDILKHYDPETMRYFLLAGHYRSPVNYSQESLDHARASLETLYTALRGLVLSQTPMINQSSPDYLQFKAAMDDDLNTPLAFSLFFDMARRINAHRQHNRMDEAKELAEQLVAIANSVGFLHQSPERFLQGHVTDSFKAQVETLIARRASARANKDWQTADQVRAELDALGVLLEDSAAGTLWRLR